MISNKISVKVEFYDVDSMNVVWHGNYVKYAEMGRCALLESINYDYEKMRDDGFAYPIVKMDFKYIKPAFFKDLLEIETKLVEAEGFLKFKYVIKNAKTDDLLCRGTTSQMAVNMQTLSSEFELPKQLIEAIERAKL